MQPRTHNFKTLLDRRFLTAYLVGISSGFPWVLHGSILTLWLQSAGLSRSAIGYIGIISASYALNWIWAPAIDRLKLPLLYRLFGQRRSWIIFCQGLIILFMLLISSTNPGDNLLLVGACALGIAVTSATQDVAIDAYRIMLFSREEMAEKIPYASAVATAGWYSGFTFIGGTIALSLGGESIGLAWPEVYLTLILFMLVLMVIVAFSPDPMPQETDQLKAIPDVETVSDKGSFSKWLDETVIRPFAEFFNRIGLKLGLGVLVFLFSFRLGEAMLGRMSLVFYVELGFTTEQIALYSSFLGGFLTIVFTFIGAFINTRFGIIRGMVVGGIAMASSNLLYALMAQVGPEPWLFMLTLFIDNFTQALATVCAISFISYFSSRVFTGTQFALMTSISNFGRTTLAASSGAIVDGLGGNWSLFFIFTTIMVIPALLILLWIGKHLVEYNRQQSQDGSANEQMM
jgi:MFS transporter, PAT family, beta-lactamase induction signal transducer AmpG